jgi:hypothetical protein
LIISIALSAGFIPGFVQSRFKRQAAILFTQTWRAERNMVKQEKVLSLAGSGRPRTANFAGTWKNEYKSTMTLAVTGNMLSGTYTSEVSGGDRVAQGTLTGCINGDLISFIVRWDKSASITAWVGHHVVEDGIEAIETLWQMTTQTPSAENPNELWHSVFAGADRFTR